MNLNVSVFQGDLRKLKRKYGGKMPLVQMALVLSVILETV